MPSVLATASDVLAAYNPEDVKPGWLGLSVVLALGLALVVLLRSFSKQLKRVNFDENAPAGGTGSSTADDRVDRGSDGTTDPAATAGRGATAPTTDPRDDPRH